MWRIIDLDVRDDQNNLCHRCECACGTVKLVRVDNIRTGTSRRCQACHLANARKQNRRSKLTDNQIAEIRSSCETDSTLAQRFGISASYANYIRRGLRLKR